MRLSRLRAATLALAFLLVAAAGPAAAQERADAEVALTYGVLAYLDKNYDEAATLLTDAARLAPENAVARYWLGLALRGIGREADAARELDAATRLDPALTVPQGQAGPSLFGADDADTPPPGGAPRISGWASFAVGTDSNPALLNDNLIAFPPGRDPLTGATRSSVGRLDVQGNIRLSGSDHAWSPEIVARVGQARYRDLDLLNSGSFEGRFQVARGRTADGVVVGPLGTARVPAGNSPVAFLLQAAAGRELIGGDPWATTVAAGTGLSLRTGGAGRFEADLLLRRVSLADDPGEPLTITGRMATLGLHQQFYLGRADRWLRVGAARTLRDVGRAYDARIDQLGVDVALPFALRWSLWISGSIGREEFYESESNPFAAGAREDRLRSGTAVLNVRIAPRVLLSGRVSRLERRNQGGPSSAAPIGLLGYRRDLATVGITWAF